MLAESDRALSGEVYFFKGNEPLLLDDPETIWLVQSGSLALFAINVKHGIPKGKRRYLFSVKAGEAMFSATLSSPDGQHQILAVALEETELSQVSKTQFCQSIVEDTAVERIERWVHHLGSAVSGITSPTLPTPLEPIGCGVLANKEVFQPPHGTIVWVQILQGHANLLGENLKALNLLEFALRGHFKELFTIVFAGIATTLLGMITPQATAILIDHAIPDANRLLLVQLAFGLFDS